MKKRRKSEWIVGILAVMLLCGGCGSGDDAKEPVSVVEEPAIPTKTQASAASETDTQASGMLEDKDTSETTAQSDRQDTSEDIQSDGNFDAVSSNVADDTWYKSGSVYVDENGRRMEVFYDDEGMLQFAVDGLSLYNTMANNYQQENNWRIYTCDDGTTVIYYPGDPAHLEISDGEYAGIYEADDGM